MLASSMGIFSRDKNTSLQNCIAVPQIATFVGIVQCSTLIVWSANLVWLMFLHLATWLANTNNGKDSIDNILSDIK